MDELTFRSLCKVINYLHDNEWKNYEEDEDMNKENHIFHHMKIVSAWAVTRYDK